MVCIAVASTYLLIMVKKYHYFEYKMHRFFIIIFTIFIIITSGFILHMDYYAYLDRVDNHSKYTEAQVAWFVLDLTRIFTPVIVILLKKNEDFFKCFSKVDDLARVSIF
jgi:hypothetical protein